MCFGILVTRLIASALLSISLDASAHSGDLDTHFGFSGTARLALSESILALPEPIAIDRTSRVIFGTSTAGGDAIGALNADGTLDDAFASAGFLTLDQYLSDLKVDSKNRIVVVQSDVGGPFVTVEVSRFLSDGSIDRGFGTGGAVVLARTDEDIVPSAIALDAADNVFVVGTEPSDPLTGDSRIVVGKIKSDGAIDPTFAGGSLRVVATSAPGTEQSYGRTIAVDRSDAVVITGYTRRATKVIVDDVVKLLPDGSLDSAFGAGAGFVQTDALPAATTPHYTISESIAIDEAGNIVTSGFAGDWADFTSSFVVTRYLPDGTFDRSFNRGLPEVLNIAGHHVGQAASVMIDARGRIVLTGLSGTDVTASNHFAVFRLNDDATRDLTFGDADGSKLLADHVAGGRGVFTHNQEILVIGNADDGRALVVSELIGYDLPPILPPTHF
jgi:uncharacterized delta-60 repeat protein